MHRQLLFNCNKDLIANLDEGWNRFHKANTLQPTFTRDEQTLTMIKSVATKDIESYKETCLTGIGLRKRRRSVYRGIVIFLKIYNQLNQNWQGKYQSVF